MATELAQAGRDASRRAPTGCASRRRRGSRPATIDTYDDHRMAMCFSLAALGGVAGAHQRSRLRAQDVSRLLRRVRADRAARAASARPARSAGDRRRRSGGVGQGHDRRGGRAGARLPPSRQRLALPAGRAEGAARRASRSTTSRALARAGRERSTSRFADGRGPARRRGRHRRRSAARTVSAAASRVAVHPAVRHGAARPPAGLPRGRRGSSPTGATWARSCSRTPRSRCS